MAIYISNINGDWWQFHEGHPLFVLDTNEVPETVLEEVYEALEGDKFEDVIMEYGREMALDV